MLTSTPLGSNVNGWSVGVVSAAFTLAAFKDFLMSLSAVRKRAYIVQLERNGWKVAEWLKAPDSKL